MKMTDLTPNTDNILSNYPSCVRKNIEELCLRSTIGLLQVKLSDIVIVPSTIVEEDNIVNNYYFSIKIPYAGKFLKWDVIFDPEDFEFTPDFDFNDDEFLRDPDYDDVIEHVPSLRDWNLKNPKALSEILNEFLLLYKKIQIAKFQRENVYSRYYEEFEALRTETHNISVEDIEVSIESNSLVFMIPLLVNCSSLPEYIQPSFADYKSWNNAGEDFALLKITVVKLDGSRVSTNLQISPRLEQMIGRNLHLPEYKRDMLLSEYVKQVSNILDNRVAFIAEHFNMKKIYITTLVAKCDHCMIEYETETFDKAVFLHSVNDYHCVVIVTFGLKFPQDKPIVTLTSIYCQEGKYCKENVDRYHYNMDSSPEENINLLIETLDEAVVRFKNHKH